MEVYTTEYTFLFNRGNKDIQYCDQKSICMSE
jgi:hypothetical protein